MEAPEWIVEEIRRQDPSLSLRWNPRRSRWEILRQDPKRPNSPPPVVKTWCGRDGSFLPLDRRIIVWLRANDVQRRFAGRQQKFFGQLVAQDLDEAQSEEDRLKQKFFEEKMAAARDQFSFYCKKLDRRGLLNKIGGLR